MSTRTIPIFVLAVAAAHSSWLNAQPAAKPQDVNRFVVKAKAALTHNFKDASSAKYRDLFVSKNQFGLYLCGEVNARNSFGGYVGFRLFYADEDSGAVQPANDAGGFESVMEQICGNRVAVVK